MKYPTLTELNTSREVIDVFRGYNHNLRIGEGEFYDMENLTSADYPVLSPRSKRGVYKSPTKPLGMISKDNLCYVDGTKFYINQNPVDGLTLNDEVCADGGKSLISMGAYVIIMPDKVWVNTQPKEDETYDHGKIEADVTIADGTATFSLCKLDGEAYTNPDGSEIPIQAAAPEDPPNLYLWLDTSSEPHTLRQYSAMAEQWVAIATTYIKIKFTALSYDLTELFADEDGITISGTEDTALSDFSNTMVTWKVGSDYIIVTGILDKVEELNCIDHPITITRKMPIMDFVIESENRLWGCHYGTALNGEVVNEIYASKLGDFKNWNCFAGISTDSYVASLGTDGQFTGAVTHLGYPIFFKENYLHKVYGNYPANYQMQTTACRGVQRGCSKSLAIVNETLYYKSRSSICAYDGSLPVEMSSELGDMVFDEAVAGVLGNKYYISMREVSDAPIPPYHLFVYDTLKGMWHREDNTQAVAFCNSRGELYYIDYADNQIKTVRGTGDQNTSAVKWKAVTGIIGTDSPDKKYISRLVVRLSLEVGTRVTFFVEYDSCGAWEHLFTMSGTSLRSFSVPIRPKRCDHMRLRIEGEGEAKIYSICKTIEQGSDV